MYSFMYIQTCRLSFDKLSCYCFSYICTYYAAAADDDKWAALLMTNKVDGEIAPGISCTCNYLQGTAERCKYTYMWAIIERSGISLDWKVLIFSK